MKIREGANKRKQWFISGQHCSQLLARDFEGRQHMYNWAKRNST